MPANDRLVEVARQWVGKAENDLTNAGQALKLGKKCPTDTVSFHAQQAVEKYLKALLAFREIEFPKVHDIESLVRLLPPGMLVDWPLREQRKLSMHAVMTRYPGNYPEPTLSEARETMRIARRVRSEIRKLLPKGALRKPPAAGRRRKA
jgi:HEPN domain-containing protein